MCFKVVLFSLFFHQYLSDSNQHLDRPCRSITGSSGYCVRLELCPFLNRLLNTDNAESKNNVTKSMCGYDTDKKWLYCCDKNDIKLNNTENIKPSAIIQDSSQSRPNQNASDIQPRYCTTPNGVRALCVSIYNCPTLLFAISQNNETVINFLRESKCGYESGAFFVCCGAVTSFAKNIEDDDNINFPANNLIPKDNCGFSSNKKNPGTNNNNTVQVDLRIFGGVNAEFGEFPWMALLEYELLLTGQKMFRCSGSLISSKYLLTAAHCVIPTPGIKLINIRLGEWDYSNEGPTTTCTRINNNKSEICLNATFNVQHESLHPHPGYKIGQKERFNDIALIRLNENINFSKHHNIRPICLPDPEEILIPGERLTISGWGLKNYNEQTTVKQKVEVPVIPISQCSIMFEQNTEISNRGFSLGRGQFCAGGEFGKDACVGDSGTPLMKLKEGVIPKWYIEGIVSYGLGCAAKDHYGIYSKVSKYIGWIYRTILP